MFYAVPTARVIFMAKPSLDIFSLKREHVWTCSVLGDCICEIRDLSLITGRGGGATKREVLLLRKGGSENVLAMLKGGHNKFWG